jgi:hypothetical protein
MKRFSQYITEEDLELGKGKVIKAKEEKEEDTTSDSKEMKFGKGAVLNSGAKKGLTDTKSKEE